MFGHIFGSCKNDPKSIAICPEPKLAILESLKPQKKLKDTLKNSKSKTSFNMFAVFWALLDPVLLLPYFTISLIEPLQIAQTKRPRPNTDGQETIHQLIDSQLRPNTESNRAQNTTTILGIFLFFLGFVDLFLMVFLEFLIIPKWLVQAPGYIAILFG